MKLKFANTPASRLLKKTSIYIAYSLLVALIFAGGMATESFLTEYFGGAQAFIVTAQYCIQVGSPDELIRVASHAVDRHDDEGKMAQHVYGY